MTAPGHELRGSTRVYDGARIRVRRDLCADPAGRSYAREVVEHPGAAVIVPRLPDGRIVFVRQYRHAIDRVLLEVPAGTLEPGEEPAACAARELEEETGYRAGKIAPLAVVYPSPGVLTEELHVFLAEDLVPGDPRRDPGEQMETCALAVEEALALLRSGGVADGKTLLSLLLLRGGPR